MSHTIVFIFLAVSSFILPFQAAVAESLTTPLNSLTNIPSQLKPPMEDVAQLDEAVEDPAEEKPYHIPMILNDSGENHLEYFKTRGRDVFQLWLDRSARYIPVMKEIFREKNLPEDLVYVAMIESGFNH